MGGSLTRAVVCVATTERYQRGALRLHKALETFAPDALRFFHTTEPAGPKHADVPYAFKATSMMEAAQQGADVILWCDASVLPIAPLEPLFQKIEAEGAWIARNGWTNYEWAGDEYYLAKYGPGPWDGPRTIQREVPHVVATAFGLNNKSYGGTLLMDYHYYATQTRAFCGPWKNANHLDYRGHADALPCGPPDVRGHRHDQTVLSDLAWWYGVQLTDPPEWFAYKGGETEKTVLMADGGYL